MIDENTFKVVIHSDEAFEEFLGRFGSKETMDRLNVMSMKLATQLVKYGDERPDWYRKANALNAVVRSRTEQVKAHDALQSDAWKELAGDLVDALENLMEQSDFQFDFEGEIDYDSVESIREYLDSSGLI